MTEKNNVPQHIAIIMDGNGRWAKQRGLSRIKGHEAGAESVRCIIKACRDTGVKYLTLYAFSVENWVRPKVEIGALMKLLVKFLKKDEHDLHENQVRLHVIGRMNDLPKNVQSELHRVMTATSKYDKGHVIFALSYGGRTELTEAMQHIARDVKAGVIQPEEISEQMISEHLYAPEIPDPDLMIRTSGEQRISNFLLWQLSYAELYFEKVYWPDFREEHFNKALASYAARKRRFGDIS